MTHCENTIKMLNDSKIPYEISLHLLSKGGKMITIYPESERKYILYFDAEGNLSFGDKN